METKLEKLKEDLDFTRGQLAAVMELMAAVIDASPTAQSVFLQTVAPVLEEEFESLTRRTRVSRDYIDGFSHACETFSRAVASHHGEP